MSNDLVEVTDTTVSIASNQTFDMVDVDSAKAFMDNYQDVCKSLLDKTDYQTVSINGKKQAFKKKSAWRKIATAFNISDEVLSKEIIRDDQYRIISATFEVRAYAPNGRTGVATASCSIFDKISKKDKEEPTPFELRQRFTNAENDVIATAHTRAKSRAIADLVGMGEVSAEELADMEILPKPKSVTVKPKKTVKTKETTPKKTGKVKPKRPKKEDEAIEVEIVGDGNSKSIKDLMEENDNIKRAVEQLQDESRIVNRDSVKDRLITMMEGGTLKEEEYMEAKKLME